VVSLSPSTTETVFGLGAGAELVARSRYCDYPPEATRLPAVGGYADPNVEAIVALAPTLVVGARGPAGPALEAALRDKGVATFFPETESLEQIQGMITELGARLERRADAERMVSAVRERVAQVGGAIAGLPRPRVLLLFDVSPIVAAGPGGFPDELLRVAGGENLVVRGGAYPTLGLETVLGLDPDVIVDGIGDDSAHGRSRVADMATQPGWRQLRALRDGAVRVVSSTTLRPGPRIGDGVFEMARAVHGPRLREAPR
jgi:iron complex transport system substrate-binding protein